MTDQPASLAEALALLQTQLPEIRKTSKAQYGSYANLTDVSRELLPVMGKLGLSFTCMPTLIPNMRLTSYPMATEPGEVPPPPHGVLVLEYMLRHAASGEKIVGFYPLPASGSPQQIGSAITYGRRYCLCAVTGAVAEEDDDGQAASQPDKPAGKTRRTTPERAAGNLPRNTDGSVSRSRTTDAELAATGQMTDQQLRDHNRLERDTKGTGPQGTTRLTETPPDDPWYDPPPAAVRQPRAAQDPAQQIAMHFQRLGITDRDVRLGYTATLAGRETLTTTKDLTAREGVAVLGKLARCKDGEALLAALGVSVA